MQKLIGGSRFGSSDENWSALTADNVPKTSKATPTVDGTFAMMITVFDEGEVDFESTTSHN